MATETEKSDQVPTAVTYVAIEVIYWICVGVAFVFFGNSFLNGILIMIVGGFLWAVWQEFRERRLRRLAKKTDDGVTL